MDSFDSRAMLLAVSIGTLIQVAMVTIGHSNKRVLKSFAAGGMGISMLAGLHYAYFAAHAIATPAVAGGAVAGGVCALIGITVSYFLKDVPASLLALGTASSLATGALGGLLGSLLA